jgi:hypothetical protein
VLTVKRDWIKSYRRCVFRELEKSEQRSVHLDERLRRSSIVVFRINHRTFKVINGPMVNSSPDFSGFSHNVRGVVFNST